MTYKEMFLSRLNETGLISGTDFIINEEGNKITIESIYVRTNYKLCFLAIQGLIYHFSNRNWITSDKYMFIRQSRHTIIFNDKSEETN